MRAMTIAWRQAQSSAALIDADLYSMLGRGYDSVGARLVTRLVVDLS